MLPRPLKLRMVNMRQLRLKNMGLCNTVPIHVVNHAFVHTLGIRIDALLRAMQI
jgi:hypothetical protein